MLVKIKKPIKGYGYVGGETAELADETAGKFIEDGSAILIPGTEGESDDNNSLPEGMPARDLLFNNGYESIEQILEARDTLVDVKGIGNAAASKIIEFGENYEG